MLAMSAPAFAQATPPHPPHIRPHLPGQPHHPLDSAQHAALHALLHGLWSGHMNHHGVSSGFDVTIAHDSAKNVMLNMHAAQSIRLGAASNFALNGEKLEWTQDVAGKSCKAAAALHSDPARAHNAAPSTPQTPELNGTFSCADGEIRFTLRKRPG